MKKYLFIAIAIFGACMLITVVMQDRKIAQLTAERDKYKENTPNAAAADRHLPDP